jgi:hypothetical protein
VWDTVELWKSKGTKKAREQEEKMKRRQLNQALASEKKN